MIFLKHKELKCYLDRRNKSVFILTGDLVLHNELLRRVYKLLIKCPNKYCHKRRLMLTSCFLCPYFCAAKHCNSYRYISLSSSLSFNSL